MQRFGTGLGYARDATDVYSHSIVLIALALVPTVVRTVQTRRGGGTPSGTLASETFVGLSRVALAAAIVGMAAGTVPAPDTAGFPWNAPGSFGESWDAVSADMGEFVFDLTSYALIYGFVNVVIMGITSEPVLGRALQRMGVDDVETATGLTRFVVKNLAVIPVALLHLLRVLRLA